MCWPKCWCDCELDDACKEYRTPLKEGDAVITPAFNIKNAKYIIHSVGPDFWVNPNAIDKLFDTYYSALNLLKENNLHSISFPLISSGIFGGNLENPAKTSAEQCIKAYNKFIESNRDYEIEVLLCAYTENEMKQIENLSLYL